MSIVAQINTDGQVELASTGEIAGSTPAYCRCGWAGTIDGLAK